MNLFFEFTKVTKQKISCWFQQEIFGYEKIKIP